MGQLEWRAIAPRLFRNVGGQGLLVFRVNQAGQATYLLFDSDPSVAYAKLAWYETPAFMVGCAALLVVFQLWTMGLWSFYAFRHVPRRSQQNTPSLIARLSAVGMQLCLLSYASAVLWLGANNRLFRHSAADWCLALHLLGLERSLLGDQWSASLYTGRPGWAGFALGALSLAHVADQRLILR
jgi:hypothetical protein